jgi:hypothetical protein
MGLIEAVAVAEAMRLRSSELRASLAVQFIDPSM